MNKICATALGLAVSASAYAMDDPTHPIIGWSWTCSSRVFYNMDVPLENNPNGNYKAVGEMTPSRFNIEIKKASKPDGIYVASICHSQVNNNYVEVWHADDSLSSSRFDSGWQTPCEQILSMKGDSPKDPKALRNVTAFLTYEHMTLDLNRDDTGWQFLITKPSLTTSQESRKLRIHSPETPTNIFDPKAGVSFITGQCIMEHDQPLF